MKGVFTVADGSPGCRLVGLRNTGTLNPSCGVTEADGGPGFEALDTPKSDYPVSLLVSTDTSPLETYPVLLPGPTPQSSFTLTVSLKWDSRLHLGL